MVVETQRAVGLNDWYFLCLWEWELKRKANLSQLRIKVPVHLN